MGGRCNINVKTRSARSLETMDTRTFKTQVSQENRMQLGLKGRTAVVTGASKGIGLAVARGLAAEGCTVQLVARNADLLEQAGQGIRDEFQVTVKTHALDLSRSESIATLLAATGTPDILVNNAGAIPGGDLQAVDEQRWRTAWDLKVFGYINMSRGYYAAMQKSGHGVIVNVTGLAADRLDFGYIAGSTGNAGLNAFTRTLGSYSLEHGIRVLAVSPGAVETERLARVRERSAARPAGHGRGDRERGGVRGVRPRFVHERHSHHRRRRAQLARRRLHVMKACLR
jgi:NAD(P)-dependent dehydrogenase (short-subunit alcohol dehydrogenase family)